MIKPPPYQVREFPLKGGARKGGPWKSQPLCFTLRVFVRETPASWVGYWELEATAMRSWHGEGSCGALIAGVTRTEGDAVLAAIYQAQSKAERSRWIPKSVLKALDQLIETERRNLAA